MITDWSIKTTRHNDAEYPVGIRWFCKVDGVPYRYGCLINKAATPRVALDVLRGFVDNMSKFVDGHVEESQTKEQK